MKKLLIITFIIIAVFPQCIFARERLSVGYIYNSPNAYSSIVRGTNGSINVVSPTGFDLTFDGRLTLSFPIDKSFVDEMHQKGIQVTPFLSNHWVSSKGKAALDNPERLVASLKEIILEKDLDGVNVDIENIPSEYRDKLTYFVRRLREELPRGKQISIAVAANPNRLTNTWVAAYDCGALARYADYLVLMAYDEHGQGGAAGPVASFGFVEKSLKVILEEVSRDKVVLGIPLYGRYWKEEAEVGGDALTLMAIEKLMKDKKLKPILDQNSLSVSVTFEVIEGEEESYYGLESGIYTIWYENEASIKAKLKLINDYDIKGSALWALSQEEKSIWNYYKTALNEKEYVTENDLRIKARHLAYGKLPIKKVYRTEVIYRGEKEEVAHPKNHLAKNDGFFMQRVDEEKHHLPIDNKKYYYLTRNQRITIKSYTTKSHLTVTFVFRLKLDWRSSARTWGRPSNNNGMIIGINHHSWLAAIFFMNIFDKTVIHFHFGRIFCFTVTYC